MGGCVDCGVRKCGCGIRLVPHTKSDPHGCRDHDTPCPSCHAMRCNMQMQMQVCRCAECSSFCTSAINTLWFNIDKWKDPGHSLAFSHPSAAFADENEENHKKIVDEGSSSTVISRRTFGDKSDALLVVL